MTHNYPVSRHCLLTVCRINMSKRYNAAVCQKQNVPRTSYILSLMVLQMCDVAKKPKDS